MIRRAICALLVVVSPVLAIEASAAAKQNRQCKTVPGVGKNCITITQAGAGGYRVRVAWKYSGPRNVGVPVPVVRSVWEANVVCKPLTARVDVLHFWDASGSEVVLAPEQQASIVAGLEFGALPKFGQSFCG